MTNSREETSRLMRLAIESVRGPSSTRDRLRKAVGSVSVARLPGMWFLECSKLLLSEGALEKEHARAVWEIGRALSWRILYALTLSASELTDESCAAAIQLIKQFKGRVDPTRFDQIRPGWTRSYSRLNRQLNSRREARQRAPVDRLAELIERARVSQIPNTMELDVELEELAKERETAMIERAFSAMAQSGLQLTARAIKALAVAERWPAETTLDHVAGFCMSLPPLAASTVAVGLLRHCGTVGRTDVVQSAWDALGRHGLVLSPSLVSCLVRVYCDAGDHVSATRLVRRYYDQRALVDGTVFLQLAEGLHSLSEPSKTRAALRFALKRVTDLDPSQRLSLLLLCAREGLWECVAALCRMRVVIPANRLRDLLWDLGEARNFEGVCQLMSLLSDEDYRLTDEDLQRWMYAAARCSRPRDAERAFSMLRSTGTAVEPKHYGALVDALARCGEPALAERYLGEMLREGVLDDSRHYAALVHGYAKKGSRPDILRCWDLMLSRGHAPKAIDYSVAMDGLLRAKDPEGAIRLFDGMRETGAEWDSRNALSALRSFALLGDLPRALDLYAEMGRRELEVQAAHIAPLIDVCVAHRHWNTIEVLVGDLVGHSRQPPIRALAAAAEAMSMNGHPEQAERLVERIVKVTGLTPVELTFFYNVLLKGYGRLDRLEDVNRLRDKMINDGVPVDRYTMGSISSVLSRSRTMDSEDLAVRGREAEQWKELAILFDDVIHELNQPIGRIGLTIERLANHLSRGDSEGASAALERLRVAARDLGDRVEVYKALTRGRDVVTTFRVKTVIAEVQELVKPQADRQGVRIEAQVAEENEWGRVPSIRGDPFLFRLAIRGLVNNAIQALADSAVEPEKRRVLITAVFTPPSARDSADGWVEIWVRDNGPGIPDDIRQRLFERGFTTRPGRGLGLGLSLVQSVAEAHGGRVRFMEHVHPGAEFWLRVPAAPAEE